MAPPSAGADPRAPTKEHEMPSAATTKKTRTNPTTTPRTARPVRPTGARRSDETPGLLQRYIARRVAGATKVAVPDPGLRALQAPVWDFLVDRYFRLEIGGWNRVPDAPSMLVGVHSGGSLTMDAWTLVYAWHRHFGGDRILHGTAHDVLMAAPLLGDYFKAMGVIPASRRGVTAAFDAGHDVVIWPGGEQDAMRNWRRRDEAVLAGRKGFVRQAIRSGVPIVPVATVGGHDTVFVLSEGRWLARATGLGKVLRGATMPIVAGPPFGLAVETVPMHFSLPAKIRTEILDPIVLDHDRERALDEAYVDAIYHQVEGEIQSAMDRLAKRRRFPVFG
jgi:1-acyl-sn-glycerol-3-phosphate acyltransferase